MTPLAWLTCAAVTVLALGVDALLDEDKRAAAWRWYATADLESLIILALGFGLLGIPLVLYALTR